MMKIIKVGNIKAKFLDFKTSYSLTHYACLVGVFNVPPFKVLIGFLLLIRRDL